MFDYLHFLFLILLTHIISKKLIRNKIEELANFYFEFEKKQNTKKNDIKTFKSQEYVLSKNLCKIEVQNSFKIRNHMIDVEENFKSSFAISFCH